MHGHVFLMKMKCLKVHLLLIAQRSKRIFQTFMEFQNLIFREKRLKIYKMYLLFIMFISQFCEMFTGLL